MERWAIYIDLEGTSKVYPRDEHRFFAIINSLIDGILRIGSSVCPASPNRLFVHQTGGDGFIIVSEFAELSPEMPLAIAVILMQLVLRSGGISKAGISQGDFADVKSCLTALQDYPIDDSGRTRIGSGLMTVFSKMGTALVNSHRLATCWPRGSRLAVDMNIMKHSVDGVIISQSDEAFCVVDWVHTKTSAMSEIIKKAGFQLPPVQELQKELVSYVASTGHDTDKDWKHYTLCLNGCS